MSHSMRRAPQARRSRARGRCRVHAGNRRLERHTVL